MWITSVNRYFSSTRFPTYLFMLIWFCVCFFRSPIRTDNRIELCDGIAGESELRCMARGKYLWRLSVLDVANRERKNQTKSANFFFCSCALFFDCWSCCCFFFRSANDEPVLQRAIPFNELETLSAGRATCIEWSIENELTFIIRSSKTITFTVACSLLSLFSLSAPFYHQSSQFDECSRPFHRTRCRRVLLAVHEINAFKWKAKSTHLSFTLALISIVLG